MAYKLYAVRVFVRDWERAIAFYTETLGFVKKEDLPMGEFRWLTVVAPGREDEVELALEPNVHPAVGPYQAALHRDGIPANAFEVDDIQREYDRLTAAGVVFRSAPAAMGPVTAAVLDDTCGNLIQLYQT